MSTTEQIAALGLRLAAEPTALKTGHPLTRFIPREELQDYAAWSPGSLAGGGREPQPFQRGRAPAPAPVPDAAQQLAAATEAGRKAGYEAGYRDGLAALEAFKRSHAQQAGQRLESLFAAAQDALAALQPQLAQAVAASAVQLARGVVRSELAQRPELIAQVAADAIDALVLSARHAVLEVHPQDRALLAQDLAERLGARGVRLQDNPTIARGGCRLQADVADVDARIEQRWQAAAQALGSALPWADEAATS